MIRLLEKMIYAVILIGLCVLLFNINSCVNNLAETLKRKPTSAIVPSASK